MFNKKNLIAATVASAFVSSMANAATIEVTDIFLESSARVVDGFGIEDFDSDADSTSVFSGAQSFNFEDERSAISAFAEADNTGNFATDAEAFDVGTATATLTQSYTVTNTSDVAQLVSFDFRIEDGDIQAQCFDGYGEGAIIGSLCSDYNLFSSYFANITYGNEVLFESLTMVESLGGVQSATLQEGTSLGEDLSPFDGFYAWDEQIFEGLELGVLQANESATLVYTVEINAGVAAIDDTVNDAFALFREGGFLNSGGAFSDPFNFNGIPFTSFTSTPVVVNNVNAPATIALFGLSALGFAFTRKRKAQ